MTPADIKADLELALLTQPELLVYLQDIKDWYVLVQGCSEIRGCDCDAIRAAEIEAWAYCNHRDAEGDSAVSYTFDGSSCRVCQELFY